MGHQFIAGPYRSIQVHYLAHRSLSSALKAFRYLPLLPPITFVCTGDLKHKPCASQPRPPTDWATNNRQDDTFDTFEKGRQTNDEPVTLKHKTKPKVIEDEWIETWQT